ncbi:ABC transporter permease [Mariniblastus sp.]|jgi:hypothetical protein|nr:ABC transporter permease [Mariniblastus sp.]
MGSILQNAIATCLFEIRSSFTIQRTSVSLVLALFPPTMLGLLILGARFSRSGISSSILQDFTPLLTIVLIGLVSLLSLILWATPNVSAELEGKSWVFIASRPGGRISIFFGKFLASFSVSYAICILSISLCTFLIDSQLHTGDAGRFWLSLSGIFFLACLTYGGIFSLLGVLFIKRAMTFSVGFVIVSDIIMASVPGVLMNKFSIRYHLQEISLTWLGWFLPSSSEEGYRVIFGDGYPATIHICILIGITLFTLCLGAWAIANREYITTYEA